MFTWIKDYLDLNTCILLNWQAQAASTESCLAEKPFETSIVDMGRCLQILLCTWIRPQHFVILVTLCFLTAFVASYAIAVTNGDVDAFFPYISDTGAKQPESSVFGFFLSLGAGAAMACIYIRHEQFADHSTVDSPVSFFLNDVNLLFGFFITIGILLVASFQETSVVVVHLIGATLTFGFGVLYSWTNAFMSYKEISVGTSSKLKTLLRLLLAVLSTIFFIGTMASASIATAMGKNKNETFMEWTKKDKGYDAHLVSTFSEWLMALCFILYFFTFYNEFKRVRLHSKVVRVYSQSSSFLIASSIPSPIE